MADGYSKLLTYIVEHQILQNDSRESELEAPATRDVDVEIAEVAEDRREDARRLAPYFADGLRQALQNNGRIVVDDRDERGNGIADAFARFLVTPSLATSVSEEIGEDHYRYTFDIDLAKVREIAQRAGVDLADA
jgi:hypothetical protein